MSLANIRMAIAQHQSGVTGDQTSGMTRAGNTLSAMGTVASNYGQSVAGLAAPLTVMGKDGNPRPPQGAFETSVAVLRRTQAAVGAVAGAINVVGDMINVGFANLTAPLAAIFPSLPAATITSLYVGVPHMHAHPPSLIPPAPPVPLPSLGPIMIGVSIQVLLGGMPAARAGDIGIAPTCGGFAPFFKVFLGSSNVFIGGKRAARILDVCRVCTKVPPVKGAIAAGKVMSAVGAAARVVGHAGKAAAIIGMAADVGEAIEAADEGNAAMAGAKALNAAMQAAQMAADMAAAAMDSAMGTDPATSPGIGAVTVPGAPTVLIGGFPMINIPNPAEALLNYLKRFKPRQPAPANGASNCGC